MAASNFDVAEQVQDYFENKYGNSRTDAEDYYDERRIGEIETNGPKSSNCCIFSGRTLSNMGSIKKSPNRGIFYCASITSLIKLTQSPVAIEASYSV